MATDTPPPNDQTGWLEAMFARWEPARGVSVEAFIRQHFPDAPASVIEVFRRLAEDAPRRMARFVPADAPARESNLADGQRIGRYELLTELGRGGMGRVYLARDPQLKRNVAVKVILGENAGGGRWERFRAEAETLARLKHPHIVPVFDVGTDNGHPFFVMEAAERGSLRDHASRSNPPWEVAQLVVLVARGVSAAHKVGVLHRDLKPHNVLLAESADEPALNSAWGWPKIADFGLSKELETSHELTAAGVPLGTPAYMAPEQVRGELTAHGFATDVYGLGTILFQMLTGRPPFGPDDTYQQILTRLPDRPSSANPQVPTDLDAICLKCLAKNPADRFATASDFAAALTLWLENSTPTASPPNARALRNSGALTLETTGHTSDPARSEIAPVVSDGSHSPSARPDSAPRRPRRVWLWGSTIALAVFGAALAIGLVARSDNPHEKGNPPSPEGPVDSPKPRNLPPNGTHTPPKYSGTVDLFVYRKDEGSDRVLALNDPRAMPLYTNDVVRVVAQVQPAAFLYAFWIDETGTATPMYPWRMNEWGSRPANEEPVEERDIKWPNGKALKIDGPNEGTETILMLARPTKLQASDDEVKQWFSGIKPVPFRSTTARVWFENFDVLRSDALRAPGVADLEADGGPLGLQATLGRRIGDHAVFSRAISFSRLGQLKGDK